MIDDTLETRGTRYGEYIDLATISQGMKDILTTGASYQLCDADMRESLAMICQKMARIVNGDPFYRDSWHDIVGYARLIDTKLEKL